VAVGLVLGRWWTLGAAAALGVWIGVAEDVVVPGWYLGLGYAVVSGLGIALGVLVRQRFADRSARTS
jgi:hypothetical protein